MYIWAILEASHDPAGPPASSDYIEGEGGEGEPPGGQLLQVSQALQPVPVPYGEGPVDVARLAPAQLDAQAVHAHSHEVSIGHKPVNAAAAKSWEAEVTLRRTLRAQEGGRVAVVVSSPPTPHDDEALARQRPMLGDPGLQVTGLHLCLGIRGCLFRDVHNNPRHIHQHFQGDLVCGPSLGVEVEGCVHVCPYVLPHGQVVHSYEAVHRIVVRLHHRLLPEGLVSWPQALVIL